MKRPRDADKNMLKLATENYQPLRLAWCVRKLARLAYARKTLIKTCYCAPETVLH